MASKAKEGSERRQKIYDREGTNTSSSDPNMMEARIFIGGLSKGINRQHIEDKFAKYGLILGVSLHKNFGFVQFESHDIAVSAVKGENRKELQGSKMDICIATERRKDKYVSEDKGEKERGEGRSSSSSSRRRHRSRSPRRRSTRERERFDRPERFSPPPPRLRGLPPMDPYRDPYLDPYLRPPDDPFDPYGPPPPMMRDYYDVPPRDYLSPPPPFLPPDYPPRKRRERSLYDDHWDFPPFLRERDLPPPSLRERDLPLRERDFPPLRERDLPLRERDLPPLRERELPLRERDHPLRERDLPPLRDREIPFPPLRERDTFSFRERDLPPPRRDERNPFKSPHIPPPPPSDKTTPDIQIIVVNVQQKEYADRVRSRVEALGLVVESLHLNPTVSLAEALENAARRGLLYTVIITTQHEAHRSVTLTILHGKNPQEHKNMPVDDAIGLINSDFERYYQATSGMRMGGAGGGASLAVPRGGGGEGGRVSSLMAKAAAGQQLSSPELNLLISSLQEKQQGQQQQRSVTKPLETTNNSIGAPVASSDDIQQQQANLQAKILSLLGSSAVVPSASGGGSGGNNDTKPAGGGFMNDARFPGGQPVRKPADSFSFSFR